MFSYFDNGDSFRAVPDDYSTTSGEEVLFPDYATEEQLQKAFPARLAAAQKEQLVLKINAELNNAIFQKYDIGTVLIFIILYIYDDTPVEVKELLKPFVPWIIGVMMHYYQAKTNIESGNAYSWDLRKFPDPKVNLSEILKSF